MSEANNLPSVKDRDFAASVAADGRTLVATMTGNADLNVKAQLDAFVAALHEEAHRRRVVSVSLDLRRLDFMNSSCLKTLVWWIGKVAEQPADAQYRIVLMSSPSLYWQRRSLNALASLANHLVTVET
jgi:hypothetical protein